MEKRIQDLYLSRASRTRPLPKPMRMADLLKLIDFDSSPEVSKPRKQQQSGSKKRNETLKKTANKENENPRKQKQPLRVPQSTVSNKTTVNPAAKRQIMYQTKFVKPAIKPSTETRSTNVHNSANTVGQNTLKRQTVHQSYALKSISENTITKCNHTLDKGLSETVHESETESVHNILKQILSRMDKLEMLIQENKQCKCHCPCKQEPTNETKQENGKCRENNTVDIVENIALCNNTILVNVTDTTEIKQTTSNISEQIIDNNVIETENVTEIVNEVLENVLETYDNKNCVSVAVHKSNFELLEDQLKNNSLASLAFTDSDDSASPVFQEIDYEYLLGEEDGNVTEIHTSNGAITRNNSTDSNDAIRTYNEMRKCIPILCTPKRFRNNNASLMTSSVQDSHKKILSHRILEQLLMLNK